MNLEALSVSIIFALLKNVFYFVTNDKLYVLKSWNLTLAYNCHHKITAFQWLTIKSAGDSHDLMHETSWNWLYVSFNQKH